MQQDGEMGGSRDDTILKKPVLTALAAIGLLVLLSSLGAGTTLAPNWVNTTGGNLAEVGSLDGGGNTILFGDTADYQTNNAYFNTTSGGLRFRNSKDQSGKMYMNYDTNDMVVEGRDSDQKLTLNDSGELQYRDWNGDLIFTARPNNDFEIHSGSLLMNDNHIINAGELNTVKYVKGGSESDLRKKVGECGQFCTVYIPSGTYNMSNTLDIPAKRVSLIGSGRGVTELKSVFSTNIVNISRKKRVSLERLTVSQANIKSGSTCINANNSQQVNLIDVETYGCDTGLSINGNSTDKAFVTSTNSRYTNANTGVRISGSLDAIKFLQTTVVANNDLGIELVNAPSGTVQFVQSNIQNPDATAINVTNVRGNNVAFDNGIIAGNEDYGIRIQDTTTPIRVAGFTVTASDQTCLKVNNASTVEVASSAITDCSQDGTDSYHAVSLTDAGDVSITGTDILGTSHNNAVNVDGDTAQTNVSLTGGTQTEPVNLGTSSTHLSRENHRVNSNINLSGNRITDINSIGGVEWETTGDLNLDDKAVKNTFGIKNDGNLNIKSDNNVLVNVNRNAAFGVDSQDSSGNSDRRFTVNTGSDIVDLDVKNARINMNSNNITNVQYEQHNVQPGDLATCDANLEGATAYNGTHWGCDGTSWNKLY